MVPAHEKNQAMSQQTRRPAAVRQPSAALPAYLLLYFIPMCGSTSPYWRGPITGTLPDLIDDTVRSASTLERAQCICEHKYFMCGGVTKTIDKEFGMVSYEARDSRTVRAGEEGERSWVLDHNWEDGHKPKRVERWMGPGHGALQVRFAPPWLVPSSSMRCFDLHSSHSSSRRAPPQADESGTSNTGLCAQGELVGQHMRLEDALCACEETAGCQGVTLARPYLSCPVPALCWVPLRRVGAGLGCTSCAAGSA